jgi:hypothetical protein
VHASDEWWHTPTGDPWWNESWYFDLAAADGSFGAYVRIGRYPAQGVVWYWAAFAAPDQPTVLVREHEVRHPIANTLEIRHEGLWADHVCEEPLERWSLGLEALGVALDDPADAFTGERGIPTPLGLDLEWETAGAPYAYPGVDRYEVPCRVHGHLLVGDRRIEVDDLPGERDHSWGHRDWWAFGWWWTTWHTDVGTHHGMALDAGDLEYHAGFVTPAGGEPTVTEPEFSAHDDLDEHGLLRSSVIRLGDVEWAVTPLAHAPVLLTDGEGRATRFARSLCRWRGDDGQEGVGWYERNQPLR